MDFNTQAKSQLWAYGFTNMDAMVTVFGGLGVSMQDCCCSFSPCEQPQRGDRTDGFISHVGVICR